MEKIIVKNHTDLPITSVMELVKIVINNGRISNDGKQYCYLTSFEVDKEEYHLVTDLRKCSDVFTFYKVNNNKQ
jgi:hypothetical protein